MSGHIDCDELLALASCNVDEHLNADLKKQLSVSLLHHIAQASASADAQQGFYAPATTPTTSFPSGGFNHPPTASWSRDETTFFEPSTRRRNPSLARARSPSFASAAHSHYAYTLHEEEIAMNGNAVENGAGLGVSVVGVGVGMDVDESLEMSDRDKQAQVHTHAHAHGHAAMGGWTTGSLVQTTPVLEQPSMNDRRSLQSGWDSPFASANPPGLPSSSASAPSYSSNNHNINVFLESPPATAASSNCSNFATSDPFYLSVAQLAAAADCRRKLEPKTFAVTSPLRFTPNPVQFGSLQSQPPSQTFNQYHPPEYQAQMQVHVHSQTSYQHQHPPPDLWSRRTELDPTLLQYR